MATAERRDFTRKNAQLATGTGGWLVGGVSPIKKVFLLFIFGF
jgi:hypothetical protein